MKAEGIPEELILEILRRLPTGECIARFRCVCKAWRTLLSDPSFILDKSVVDDCRPQTQTMINYVDENGRSVYSLYSANTLLPAGPPVQLPFIPEKYQMNGGNCEYFPGVIQVAGSCNGLICISDGAHDLILWNPATSETKVLPPSPSLDLPEWDLLRAGFGFDSEKNDYKIGRQFRYLVDTCSLRKCCYQVEVYSLRNDSWTILPDHVDNNGYHPRPLTDPQIPQLHHGKLYWSLVEDWESKSLELDSFDISRQEFQKVELSRPCANLYGAAWRFSFNEDSLVALFELYDHADHRVNYGRGHPKSWEIWILLKYWVPESWTKLLVITSPPPGMIFMESVGITRNLKWLFLADRTSLIRKGDKKDMFLMVFHPEMEKYKDLDLNLYTRELLDMTDYTPSQVCISDYCISS